MPETSTQLLKVENHFKRKVLVLKLQPQSASFPLDTLKTTWMRQLRFWHTPYRALVIDEEGILQSQQKAFLELIHFLKGFHLKEVFLVAPKALEGLQTFSSLEAAEAHLQLQKQSASSTGFQITSQFEEGFLEIESNPSQIDQAALETLKRQVFAELMRWHAPFCLLWNIDETEFEVSSVELKAFYKSLLAFHCIDVIVYESTHSSLSKGPLDVTLGRHKALEKSKQARKAYCLAKGLPLERYGCAD